MEGERRKDGLVGSDRVRVNFLHNNMMNRIESLGGKMDGFVFQGSAHTTSPRKMKSKLLTDITNKLAKRATATKPTWAGSKTGGG